MRCDEAAALLTRLLSATSTGEPVSLVGAETAVFRDLAAGRFVAPVQTESVDPAKSDTLRARLRESQDHETDLRRKLGRTEPGFGDARARRDLLRELDDNAAEQAGLRGEILELAEEASRLSGSVSVDGRRHVVTFRGKELLFNLTSRLPRVGELTLEQFDHALADLRGAFSGRAETASRILRELSPRLPRVEEIHVRSAAVGLALREEPPEVVARGFRAAFDAMDSGMRGRRVPTALRPFVAETLCVGAASLDPKALAGDVEAFAELWEAVDRMVDAATDAELRAALMLRSLGTRWRDVFERALAVAREVEGSAPPDPAAAVLLVHAMETPPGPRASRYRACLDALRGHGVPEAEVRVAAALLVTAGDLDLAPSIDRLAAANEYLSRFNGEGMSVPAAMLAILSPHLEESLDNLRLASAAISRHRLSIGGMENLSLGIKLLLETAVAPGPIRSMQAPTLGSTPTSSPAPRLALLSLALGAPFLVLPALAAFHETALHRLAVQDASFHPVHVHYVYG